MEENIENPGQITPNVHSDMGLYNRLPKYTSTW